MKEKEAMQLWQAGNYFRVAQEKWQSLSSFIYLGIFARPVRLVPIANRDEVKAGEFNNLPPNPCLMIKITDTHEKILAIDIGGSRIKAILLDVEGNTLIEYQRLDTPHPATPERVMETIAKLTEGFPGYTRVSVGFPGYVKNGIVHTAPNLGNEYWHEEDLAQHLTDLLIHPVRVVNDADLQGLGVARGKGLEMVITLGTGFGTSLLMDGILLPHLELAHHPISKDREYDDYIGNRGFEDVGAEKWNRRLQKVLEILKTVFNYDYLYISGGNAKKIDFQLDQNITVATNLDGIRGGAKLWLKDHYNV